MQTSVKEDQIILCSKHGQEVIKIVLDTNYIIDDRMLCVECIKTTKQPYKSVIGVAQALEMIKERIIKQNTQIEEKTQPYINKLTNLQSKLFKLRETFIKTIDNMIEFMQKWVSEMNNSINKTDSIELKTGLEMLQQDNQESIEQLENNGKAYIIKLSLSFKKLLKMEGIQQCQQELINLPLSNQQIQQQNDIIQTKSQQIQQESLEAVNKKHGNISCELVNQVKQEQSCFAIAFNNTGTIMVAGFKGDIKVWQFNDGKIDELTKLRGQSDCISCLIFSKMNQLFVSGDEKGNIQLFKQGKSNKGWLQSNILKKHTDWITCIILNQKEDQLITCSDNTILVWQVNYSNNQLEYSYTLDKKHTNHVYGLSLNESNTLLISCGDDRQIILWIQGRDDKWKFKNSISMNNSIPRICFINDNEFVVQQWGEGYSNVFQIQDCQLKEQENFKIKLTDKNGYDDYLFPTIYNKKNDVIIQKSDKFVYIIRREINGQFKVQAQSIDCGTEDNYGSMTENGQHLAVWNRETREFTIYKLNQE